MSKTKGGGSTRNGRNSKSKRLGVKAYGGTTVPAGAIIVRRARYQVPPGRERGPRRNDTAVRDCCRRRHVRHTKRAPHRRGPGRDRRLSLYSRAITSPRTSQVLRSRAGDLHQRSGRDAIRGDPCSEIAHHRHPEQIGPEVTCGDRLEHARHTDEICASARSMRISAGVSKCGPGIWA